MKKLIRIIPSLLLKDNYLVKGQQFKNHKYVGDIFNAVKIFSEKKVHEIQILDISVRKKKMYRSRFDKKNSFRNICPSSCWRWN